MIVRVVKNLGLPFSPKSACGGLLALVLSVTLGVFSAWAQSNLPKSSVFEPDPDGWRVRAGGAVLVKPEYLGSDDYEVIGVPNIDVKYGSWFFANPIHGVGVNVFNKNGLKAGAAVHYRFGRDEDDGELLHGLGDIDDEPELRGFISYLWGPIQISSSYKYGVGGDNTGGLFDIGLGSALPLSDGFVILGQVKAEFMDSEYADAFFSVDAMQSARSGLPIYDSASGWRSVSASLMGVYDVTDRWTVQAVGTYTHLGAHAADSPIVESESQFLGGLGLTYKLFSQ